MHAQSRLTSPKTKLRIQWITTICKSAGCTFNLCICSGMRGLTSKEVQLESLLCSHLQIYPHMRVKEGPQPTVGIFLAVSSEVALPGCTITLVNQREPKISLRQGQPSEDDLTGLQMPFPEGERPQHAALSWRTGMGFASDKLLFSMPLGHRVGLLCTFEKAEPSIQIQEAVMCHVFLSYKHYSQSEQILTAEIWKQQAAWGCPAFALTIHGVVCCRVYRWHAKPAWFFYVLVSHPCPGPPHPSARP